MFKTGSTNQERKSSSTAPADISKKLTARDIALGIGRKATDEELDEYLNRPYGKSMPLDKAIAQIKAKPKKKK